MRRSRSTAQKRKLPDGWPPPTRLLTCRGTRSTLGPSMPRHGCPSTAPSTGYARSTATNPGTTNCAPKPSITVARRCTPTLRTIQGCSNDQHARQRTGVNLRPGAGPFRCGDSRLRPASCGDWWLILVPSLPWSLDGERWQLTATVFAYLSRSRSHPICRRLPPVAPAGLHKGSILSCLLWLHNARRVRAARFRAGHGFHAAAVNELCRSRRPEPGG
jgi:hypothetical protein